MAQLVIAKYNEDISWIKPLAQKHEIIIYDKSGQKNGFIDLENVGRESHTFLYHIINNYRNLADYTVFLQGDPLAHWDRFDHFDANEYKPLGTWYRCDKTGLPHHAGLPLEYLYEALKTHDNPMPDLIEFYAGAQYVVPKQNILHYPIQFYQKAYEMHYSLDIMPWVIERFWDLIWTNKL